MKTIDDSLFLLIKSLSRSEKRYFKVQAQYSTTTKFAYLKLFEAIEDQEKYDEGLLIEVFKGTNIANRLAPIKYQLYQLILKNLRHFNSGKSYDIEVKEAIINISILYNKGLYKQCLKIIKKANKLAILNHDIGTLINLVEWERTIIKNFSNVKNPIRTIEASIQKENDYINQYNEILVYKRYSYCIYFFQSAVTFNEPILGFSNASVLKQKLEEALKKQKIGFIQKYWIYSGLTLYHLLIGSNNDAYYYAKKNIELLESDSAYLKYNAASYLSLMANYLQTLELTRRYDELFQNIDRFKEIGLNTMRDETFKYEVYYNILFKTHIYKGNFDKAISLKGEVLHFIETYKKSLNLSWLSIFYYHMCKSYIGIGDYESALTWINTFLNEDNIKYPIYMQVLFLNLLVHFELKNYILIENLLLSSYGKLKDKKNISQQELLMFDFFKSLAKSTDHDLLINNLYKDMHNIKNEKELYFPFNLWVKSKVLNVNFANLIQDAAKEDTVGNKT